MNKEFRDHKKEVLDRFSLEFRECYAYSHPIAGNIIMALMHGENPYIIIEDLLKAYESQRKEFKDLIMNGPAPKYMVVTQETFDEISKTGKL